VHVRSSARVHAGVRVQNWAHVHGGSARLGRCAGAHAATMRIRTAGTPYAHLQTALTVLASRAASIAVPLGVVAPPPRPRPRAC